MEILEFFSHQKKMRIFFVDFCMSANILFSASISELKEKSIQRHLKLLGFRQKPSFPCENRMKMSRHIQNFEYLPENYFIRDFQTSQIVSKQREHDPMLIKREVNNS